MKAKVKATKLFEKYTDKERNCKVKEGDVWETSYDRAIMLEQNKVVEIIEVINPVENVEKVVEKKEKKTTTTRKPRKKKEE